jgi:carnitine-CoA ligase
VSDRRVCVVREVPRSTLRKVDKVELRVVASRGGAIRAAEPRWLHDAAGDPSGDDG